MTFAQRMTYAMATKGINQTELSRATGIPIPSLSHYSKGRYIPKQDRLVLLAKALNVSEKWLMGMSVPMEPEASPLDGLSLSPNQTQIPVLGEIACGEPITANESADSFLAAPAKYANCFGLVCKGDSMIGARIYNGDIVIIRPQPDVETGEIAAVRIENEATLKRVYKLKGAVILRAENPQYSDLVYTPEQFLTVQIIGKAVGFFSALE